MPTLRPAAIAALTITAAIVVIVATVAAGAVGTTVATVAAGGAGNAAIVVAIVARRGDHTGRGLSCFADALVARIARGWARPVARTGWAMRVAAQLMPRAVGERWLGEAENFLFEAPAQRRAKVTRNYLITAPQVIMAGWANELARRAKRPVTGRVFAKARRS